MFKSRREMFPELARAMKNPRAAARSRTGRALLRRMRPRLEGLKPLPETTYSLYRQYSRNGNRSRFERPFFAKRANLVAAAAVHFLEPDPGLLDVVQDYIWDTCEETTWILPAHERGGMDLFSTETAFCLAEVAHLLRGQLAAEVVERVEHEVRRRVTDPYLAGAGKRRPAWGLHEPNLTDLFLGRQRHGLAWYKHHNNWCGVCNGSVGAALLYCERDPRRLAAGLNLVLEGLEHFLGAAFSADGASNEGVSYWQYGLINYIAFAELLRCRTGGKVDLLAEPKLKLVARFPLGVRLSGDRYYNHADCPPRIRFNPGVIARLAARTGTPELLALVADAPGGGARMPMLLRDLLWWDGRRGRAPRVEDSLLPAAGIFRLVRGGLVLAGKAGHNAESHNHNDVGSFVLHSRGEDLLCDPGAPPYTREFFQQQTRYKLFLHTRSSGHSLPVIGGREQEFGRKYRGKVTSFEAEGRSSAVEMQLAGAYPERALKSFVRRLELFRGGRFALRDEFAFSGKGRQVEEAFVTWLPVRVNGASAVIRGEKSRLRLRILEPRGARFRLERHDLETKSAPKQVKGAELRRLIVRLPKRGRTCFVMEGRLET
jgi:hypothetical protein